ncbi:unnamed protein product [Somion occarium]|uniref:AB hydrolase-1 domain-containing protein n=1 Tax=Somion occarium TaxID=3059160 RepID=A0ABP1DA56_9APHY
MSGSLFTQTHVLPAQTVDGHDIKVVVARYSKLAEPPAHGRILILIHAVSAHKEHWLPILNRLFAQDDLNISEAWSFDAPNHGGSLAYNKYLIDKPDVLNDLSAYGQCLLALLRSGLINLNGRELIPIGHSAGTNALVRCAMAYIRAGEPIPYKTAILIESVFLSEELGAKIVGRYKPAVKARKWRWGSRQEAEQFINNTQPWKKWHKEIRDIYVEYGMNHTVAGSELKCPSRVEAACYPNASVQAEALKNMPTFCENIKAHLILGTKNDFVPKEIRDPFVTFAESHMRSIRYVEGAGHMVVQEDPVGCAKAISDVLRSLSTSSYPPVQVAEAKL